MDPYRFCSDGNPTTLSILLWSYLILSDTHISSTPICKSMKMYLSKKGKNIHISGCHPELQNFNTKRTSAVFIHFRQRTSLSLLQTRVIWQVVDSGTSTGNTCRHHLVDSLLTSLNLSEKKNRSSGLSSSCSTALACSLAPILPALSWTFEISSRLRKGFF